MVAFFHLPLNIARSPLFAMSFKRVNVDLWKINDMNHNWHIGQDIVCIKTHSQRAVKEGNVYTIKSLKGVCCRIAIDIGAKAPDLNGSGTFQTICGRCKKNTYNHYDNIYWIAENLFAPLDTLTDISEIEEILSQPIESLFKV